MKSLKEYIKESEELPKIYLDMDQVLSGFLEKSDIILEKFGCPRFNDEGWNELGEETADDVRWAVIMKHEGFWTKLPFLREGRRLWEFVRKYKPGILSQSQYRMTNCKEEKMIWLNEHLGNDNLSDVHISDDLKDKTKYAISESGRSNILIDDRYENCEAFRESGGIAIQFVDAKSAIRELKKLGFK